jgi:hypothetical protein
MAGIAASAIPDTLAANIRRVLRFIENNSLTREIIKIGYWLNEIGLFLDRSVGVTF